MSIRPIGRLVLVTMYAMPSFSLIARLFGAKYKVLPDRMLLRGT
jgi:hypothetical protein